MSTDPLAKFKNKADKTPQPKKGSTDPLAKFKEKPIDIKAAQAAITPKFIQKLLDTKPEKIIADVKKKNAEEYKKSTPLQKIIKSVKLEVPPSAYLDEVEKEATQKAIEEAKKPGRAFQYGMLNASSLDTFNKGTKAQLGGNEGLTDISAKEHPYITGAGTVAGYALPMSAATKATAGVTQALTKGVGSKLGKEIIKGAVAGSALDTTQGILNYDKNKSVAENAKDIGYRVGEGAVLGAAGDLLMSGTGKVLSKAGRAIAPKLGIKLPEAAKEVATVLDNTATKEPDKTSSLKQVIDNASAKKDISGFQAYTTDVYRNFEKIFKDDYQTVKKAVLDPFDEAKKAKVLEDKDLMTNLKRDIVDKFKISKGSKESALIQQFGEKRISYNELVEKVGKDKADNIVEADKWFRKQYDKMIDEINDARKKIYPNVENDIANTKAKIQKNVDTIAKKTKELENINPTTKKYEQLQTQISNLKERVNKNQELLQSDELWRGKRIEKRNNYYRHFKELSNDFAGLKNIFDTPSQIDPRLAGISEFTKPNAKFNSIMQKRGMGKFKDDAVGGFLDYINAATYAKHIDTQIPKFRQLVKDLGESTSETANINNFLNYLTDFTDDLAGKTNPADRFFQKIIPGGRTTMAALNWTNNRIKKNTVMMNLSSALSQIANVPQGIAYVKNPAQLTKGAGNMLASWVGKGDSELYKQSGFLLERYSDDIARQFDTKLLQQPEKMASWMLSALDNIGTKFIWSSNYQKALAEGVANPIKHADDITRKLVAGRGIGEVPLLQKSKIMQLVAPFTLEVNNLWKVQKDFIDAKDFKGLVMLYLANYTLNRGMEQVRGNGVVFDPVNALIQAATEKDLTPAERAGRLGGEILSNMPLGSTAASLYPEYGINNEFVSLPSREKLFGRNDPTRFGSGLLVAKGLQDPLYKLLPSFGGGQAKKTIEAGQDLGLLPKVKKEDGKITLKRQDIPASYSVTKQGDRMRTTINPTLATDIKGLAFGRSAIPEVKKYYESGKTPLGTTQTKNIQELFNKGYDPNELFNALNSIRGTTKKEDIIAKLAEYGYNDSQIAEIWEVFYK